MWSDHACKALQDGVVLQLSYDGFTRHVEVHAVGVSTAGHAVMRCWQIRGGSVHDEPVGWKLMRLDEGHMAQLTGERSEAPRSGYKRNDRAMRQIIAQV